MTRTTAAWVGPAVTGLSFCLFAGHPEAQSAISSHPRPILASAGSLANMSGPEWVKLLGGEHALAARERLLVVGRDGAILETVDGEAERVQLPAAMASALVAGSVRTTLVHNHPRLAGLSTADLQQLDKRGVDRILAVTVDGTVFSAAAGAGFDAGFLCDGGQQSLEARVRARLADEAWRAGVAPNDVQRQSAHVVSLVLHAVGLIDYQVKPSLVARLEFDRYREIFTRVVHLEVDRVRRDRATSLVAVSRRH